MALYANQQTIIINFTGEMVHKKDELNSDGTKKQFLQAMNWEPMLDIMAVLSGNEYLIYMYLMKWAGKEGGYQFSPADIEKHLGIGESTSQKTKKKFIELGILIKQSTNKYEFNPYPEGMKQKAELARAKYILKRENNSAADL